MKKKEPSRVGVREMFNKIAYKYDSTNALISFGLDKSWRKKMALLLPNKPSRVLDIATGSGDVLVTLHKEGRVSHGVGLDFSESMLNVAKRKIAKNGLSHVIRFLHGDAMDLPFHEDKFDVTTIAFGIRNVKDVDKTLKEMHRVLKPEGTVMILEFSIPKNIFIRGFFKIYLSVLLPYIGGLFAGNIPAYKYLNKTIKTFPSGEEFAKKMKKAGFRNLEMYPVIFGVATIYKGIK